MQESRIKNTTRNSAFAAINFLVKLLLNFILRTVFLRYLSVEYLGLNSLFVNVLNILSLAELGVGHAIVYSMYKPIAEGDNEKIKSLVALYRKLYFIIGISVCIIGLAIIPLLPLFISGEANVDVNLTAVYVVYLFNVVSGYLFSYRTSLIFAYQRNDIESKSHTLQFLLLNLTQIAIIIFTQNYYAFIIMMPLFTLLEGAFLLIISYKLFPKIRGKAQKLDTITKKEISRNTSALVIHKVGGAVVFSTDNIVISSFLGLTVLGLYSNYYLIISSLIMVITLFTTAIRGSVGNLIASADKDESFNIFKALNFVLFWIIGFFFICLITLFQDFIGLWLGEEFKIEFIVMLIVCISFYLTQSRAIVLIFKDCAGLFRNDRYKPVLESIVNIVFDILLVIHLGLVGVFLATIISTVTTCLWIEPFVVFRNYFKKSVLRYFLRYLFYTSITALVAGLTFAVCYMLPTGTILYFILKAAICFLLPNLIFFLIYFKTSEFKYLLTTFKNVFLKRQNKSDNSKNIEQ